MLSDPTELMMGLTKQMIELKRKSVEKGWTWKSGMEIYVNPEARCPWCNEGFPTRRVWLVDTERKKLLYVWRLTDASKVEVMTGIYHPHCPNNANDLCFKYAKTAAQLLFNSIDPGYSGVGTWLWDMGHECPKFKGYKRLCIACNQKVPDFVLTRRWATRRVCSAKCVVFARENLCERCVMNRVAIGGYKPEIHKTYCRYCYDFVNTERQEAEVLAVDVAIPDATD